MLSPLYPAPVVDPRDIGYPLVVHGPYVYTLEKRYTTQAETTMHAASATVFRKALARRSLPPVERSDSGHYLLCDPRGLAEGKLCARVASTSNLKRAIRLADYLAEFLAIRFLVATVRCAFRTR